MNKCLQIFNSPCLFSAVNSVWIQASRQDKRVEGWRPNVSFCAMSTKSSTRCFSCLLKERLRCLGQSRWNCRKILYQRRKADFHVVSGMLYFQGKQIVTTSHAHQVVKSTFKRNLGSASRSTWQQMNRMWAGVSFEMVKCMLSKSQLYQRHRPMFKNKVPPKPVRSGQVNECWQIDLIDMHSDEVLYERKLQRYILSIIYTFSCFLLLWPLARKTSANVAQSLKRVFAEHGVPNIV